MTKRIIILGSTGSIGQNALDVIAQQPGLEAVGLSTFRRTRELEAQISRHRPKAACAFDANFRSDDCRVFHGPEGLVDMVRDLEADIVLAAITGAAGLPPVLAAIETGKDIALANKEALVVAGPIVTELARRHKVNIIPVDSEHSAIFQSARSGAASEIKTITLTASGGPFLRRRLEDLQGVTVAEAVAHPIWSMGPKISVDSATMMNKALEVLEACYLFDVAPEQVRVLIHPQSIVHSMVEFVDHSVVAQLGAPDMKIPIQFALTWPERKAGPTPRLDLAAVGRLEFEDVDEARFPAIPLSYEVARRGGTAGAVFNGANESAVARFIAGDIPFTRIPELVRSVVDAHETVQRPTLQDVLEADRWARKEIDACLI